MILHSVQTWYRESCEAKGRLRYVKIRMDEIFCRLREIQYRLE